MAIGPISVSILMTFFAFSWRQVYLFWFIPMLIGLFLVLMIRSEPTEDVRDDVQPQSSQQASKGSLFTFSFILFLVFLAVRSLGVQMFDPFLTVFLVDERGLDVSLASMVLGGHALVGIVSAPIGGFLASKFGEKRWLLITLTLAFALLAVAITVTNIYVFIVLYISHGFCSNLGWAAHSSITATLSPSRQRGLGYAFYFLPGEIMGVVALLIAPSVAVTFGLTSLFIVSLAIQAVSIAVLKFGVKV
jgi:MFS family permease